MKANRSRLLAKAVAEGQSKFFKHKMGGSVAVLVPVLGYRSYADHPGHLAQKINTFGEPQTQGGRPVFPRLGCTPVWRETGEEDAQAPTTQTRNTALAINCTGVGRVPNQTGPIETEKGAVGWGEATLKGILILNYATERSCESSRRKYTRGELVFKGIWPTLNSQARTNPLRTLARWGTGFSPWRASVAWRGVACRSGSAGVSRRASFSIGGH
ncbi:hypothetical protein C8F04DRAFT_1198197 [Mycena alexandri]|uniref:Uncharacterized protein n=1 Tax=Mycena alexandri TaxID=1745969 RepID=A0AAD6S0F6_9AGAR|nr:hypothetical protein C8F04DRAFT_1198197 [Mycena alexandri]